MQATLARDAGNVVPLATVLRNDASSILGAGTMGHGIAQVAAMAGHEVTMRDIEAAYVDDGLDAIESNLRGGVDRDKVTPDELGRRSTGSRGRPRWRRP